MGILTLIGWKKTAKYNDFILTDAVRPSHSSKIVPRTGFKHGLDKDGIPGIMISLSEEIVFEVFMEMIDLVGDEVDVVLEDTYNRETGDVSHTDFRRENIDIVILKSILWDFEDLLLNCGCTGIAVLNPEIPIEIQLDGHKLLIVYDCSDEILRILADYGVPEIPKMKFITYVEHIHFGSDKFEEEFEKLKFALGAEYDIDEEIDDLFSNQED